MTLTAEQIAEKIDDALEIASRSSEFVDSNGHKLAKEKLTSIIRDLQKETWDAACKAQADLTWYEDTGKPDGHKYSSLAPFNPDK